MKGNFETLVEETDINHEQFSSIFHQKTDIECKELENINKTECESKGSISFQCSSSIFIGVTKTEESFTGSGKTTMCSTSLLIKPEQETNIKGSSSKNLQPSLIMSEDNMSLIGKLEEPISDKNSFTARTHEVTRNGSSVYSVPEDTITIHLNPVVPGKNNARKEFLLFSGSKEAEPKTVSEKRSEHFGNTRYDMS